MGPCCGDGDAVVGRARCVGVEETFSGCAMLVGGKKWEDIERGDVYVFIRGTQSS